MCFSASASFGAGVVLTGVGMAAMRKVPSNACLPFASIPLIFGVQQITEGFLWLALSNFHYAAWQVPATYLFLFFAQVVWPSWVGFAMYRMEIVKIRRQAILVLLGIGVLVSAYLAYCLLNFRVEAAVAEHHIAYQQDYPESVDHSFGWLYVVATITPAMISSIRRMWLFGIAVLVSYIITALFYTGYIVSVWCFFAAVISVVIYAILPEGKPAERKINPATI